MEIDELKKLRAVIRAFAKNLALNWTQLRSNEVGDRYRDLYMEVAKSVDDPLFRQYVQIASYRRVSPANALISRQYATMLVNSVSEVLAYLDAVIEPERAPVDSIAKKQALRYLLLKKLYDLTDGDEHLAISMGRMADELGIDMTTADRVVQYLESKELTGSISGAMINITTKGIDQVESGIKSPDKPTDYFPPFANMQIVINHSNIHGGVNVASLIQDSYNKAEASGIQEELKQYLKELSLAIAEMTKELPEDDAEQVTRDLSTFTAEVTSRSPRPNHWTISLDSLKTAANNVAAIGLPVLALAEKIVPLLTHHVSK